jgi:hypothetical protein
VRIVPADALYLVYGHNNASGSNFSVMAWYAQGGAKDQTGNPPGIFAIADSSNFFI